MLLKRAPQRPSGQESGINTSAEQRINLINKQRIEIQSDKVMIICSYMAYMLYKEPTATYKHKLNHNNKV